MKSRIHNILVALLWLLAVSLGANFWFNTKYGFNIFLVQHWQYLAYMQASGQPVRPSFYISLVIMVIIAVFGLYVLLQPRYRRIAMPIIDKTPEQPKHPEPTVQDAVQAPVQTPQPITTDATPKSIPTPSTPEPAKPSAATPGMLRPPRLNIPTITRTSAPTPHIPLSSTPKPSANPEQEYADIHEIFTSAGYLVKGRPRIKGIQTSVIAIGTGEILWIGATGVSSADMQRAVDTLSGVFSDTLEDIEININAFIIGASDNTDDNSIMHFASVDDLRSFISEHPNPKPDEDEAENFDAYSGYIGTVIDYIGKI